MAINRRTLSNYLFLSLIYSMISDFRVVSEYIPDTQIIQSWTTELAAKFKQDFRTTTGYDILSKDYNGTHTLESAGGEKFIQLSVEVVHPEKIINDAANALSSMFDRKKEALNNSVSVAEKVASSYKWNSKITTDDVDYESAKKIMDNDTRLEFNERFKQKIMSNVSSVHIPVEIFDGDVEILNGLAWSGNLDSVFKENFKDDPEILWQYFGSQTGFMRTWPGSRWKLGPKEVDLYDVRRRPWYTQGSSSPKDMMILIDVSGSVFGQALELMKVSVKSLLDTLGENDFVNIATFSEKADYVTQCFGGEFVQANYRNKKILMEKVDEIQAGGMANFELGLTFAFKAFLKMNDTDNRHGANCNKMIMLLTDGGTDYAEEVFEKYNPKDNKTYRVFTYAVGPTANPTAAIKWMACANRGYFSKIPAMGAIRSKVQEYMKYPVKAMESHYIPLPERYRLSISRDDWGLGMMTTVTLPVYNKTTGSNNQTILGVMGVDVTTEEMLKLIPSRKFGPNGFPFAINSNGYIVFHDGLKPQPGVKDPPNVDFLDLEVETPEKVQLRKDMIDMKAGKMVLDSYTIEPDQRHIDRETDVNKRSYYYKGINGTTFSLGLSIPAHHKFYLSVNVNISELIKETKDILNASYTALLIADWEYYPGYLKKKDRTGTVLDLEDVVKNPDKYLSADRDLIYHLLWDLEATRNVGDLWTLVKNSNTTKPESVGMQGVFVGTNGGLTRIFPKSEDLVKFFMDKRDTWSTTYYKRAINSPNYIFSAPYVLDPTKNSTVNDVMVVRSVSVTNSNFDSKLSPSQDYKTAVVGAVFSHQSMLDRLTAITSSYSLPGMKYDCSQSEKVACHLLDDGGFLLVTNQEAYNTSVGRFFGHVDLEVMKDMYNKSIYERLEQYDFQAICTASDDDDSSSAGFSNFNIPSVNLFYEFLTFNWWTSVVTWTFTNLNLYNMLFSSQVQQAEAYVHPDKEKPCIKMHAIYYVKENLAITEGQTDECEVRMINCSRSYTVAPVEGTNLLLVISEVQKEECKVCEVLIDKTELIQEPTKRVPDFCEIKPRYRRPTDECFDHDPLEDATKCAGSFTHPVSYLVTGLVAIATSILILR